MLREVEAGCCDSRGGPDTTGRLENALSSQHAEHDRTCFEFSAIWASQFAWYWWAPPPSWGRCRSRELPVTEEHALPARGCLRSEQVVRDV